MEVKRVAKSSIVFTRMLCEGMKESLTYMLHV